MATNRVGEEESNRRYFVIYLIGILLGSCIRAVRFVVPTRAVSFIEEALLGDKT